MELDILLGQFKAKKVKHIETLYAEHDFDTEYDADRSDLGEKVGTPKVISAGRRKFYEFTFSKHMFAYG